MDPSTCLNGNGSGVNCNIYTSKDAVYASGGPVKAGLKGLPNGTYFFAVLAPSGQSDPNDLNTTDLLSTDAYTCREFQISAGALTYPTTVSESCPHVVGSIPDGNTAIQLMPYSDTPNPGGVYILAVCQLPDSGLQPVEPSDCKYDAFKVQEENVVPPAADLFVTKDAAGTDVNTFTWGITKAVDKTTVNSSDGSATFNYTVTVTHDGGTISNVQVTGTIQVFNPNSASNGDVLPVAITSVTDQLSDGTTLTDCTVTGGASTLTIFETDFDYTCSLSGLPQTPLNNTATVKWDDQTLSDGASLTGGSAKFVFSNITFTETKVDDCVNVTDTLGGALGTGPVCSGDASPTIFSYPFTFTGDPAGTCTTHPNTATFTSTTTTTTGSANASVKVCVGADLTVEKSAKATFTRTYNWTIAKNVDKTFVRQLTGSVTFNYTVNVNQSQTPFTDSGWLASGTITITNPNDWESITANVTDLVNNGGICVLDSASVTVPASGSKTDNYTCTYASAPSPQDGTNTATATWDAGAASTPDGSASGAAAVNFDNPTTRVNQTITVKDTFNGTTTTLGTLTATDSTPFASAAYTYSHTVPVTVNACVSYTNTAVIFETGQSDSKTVTVCGGVAGGLTMGFWQNKNGQGIITGGASTSGVCNSATWLRQYAPFQDLSSTATCSQVATYVLNVIKAANASGSSMNAMLKAQMLATALDVYFSDPLLGTNKINAPAPLGGIYVDLTVICNMIDSGGVAACSGTYQDTSAAFGNTPKCQTVQTLLTYAASQSNSGGSTWYGNVKSTQGLAKNTFDAINNGVAFSCTP